MAGLFVSIWGERFVPEAIEEPSSSTIFLLEILRLIPYLQMKIGHFLDPQLATVPYVIVSCDVHI